MGCKNCPCGKEDFERRMGYYEKTVQEQGVPNDICHYLEPEDAEEEFEQFINCEKVGGKVYCFGHCEDAYDEPVEEEVHYRKRETNKRARLRKERRKLKHLSETCCGYPPSAIYMDEVYIKGQGYVENPKPYYKRLYRGRRSTYYKKQSNKAIRRYKGEIANGQMCHRIYDFWWQYS